MSQTAQIAIEKLQDPKRSKGEIKKNEIKCYILFNPTWIQSI